MNYDVFSCAFWKACQSVCPQPFHVSFFQDDAGPFHDDVLPFQDDDALLHGVENDAFS
jgi:hypothetical protein